LLAFQTLYSPYSRKLIACKTICFYGYDNEMFRPRFWSSNIGFLMMRYRTRLLVVANIILFSRLTRLPQGL
jgi:hypothetical protein